MKKRCELDMRASGVGDVKVEGVSGFWGFERRAQGGDMRGYIGRRID